MPPTLFLSPLFSFRHFWRAATSQGDSFCRVSACKLHAGSQGIRPGNLVVPLGRMSISKGFDPANARSSPEQGPSACKLLERGLLYDAQEDGMTGWCAVRMILHNNSESACGRCSAGRHDSRLDAVNSNGFTHLQSPKHLSHTAFVVSFVGVGSRVQRKNC